MPDATMFCDEDDLAALYGWIDDISDLSREKRNITRDFADGVMAAEVIAHFLPRIVELHNYQPASSKRAKMNNWNTINKKVLKKLKMNIPDNVIEAIVTGIPGVVEVVLIHIRNAILRATKPKGWESQLSGNHADEDENDDEMEEERKRREIEKQREREERDREPDLFGTKEKRRKTKKKKDTSRRHDDGGDGAAGDSGKLPAIEEKRTKKKKKKE